LNDCRIGFPEEFKQEDMKDVCKSTISKMNSIF